MINFVATAYYSDAKYTCETSCMTTLINFLNEHSNTQFDVINGMTGEVLSYCNCPGEEDYLETNFMYLVIGWMMMNPLA